MRGEEEELYKEREERIQTAVNLGVPDRVPVICSEYQYAGAYAGVSSKDFMTDNEKMMMALEKFHLEFQLDMHTRPPLPMSLLTMVIAEPCLVRYPWEGTPFNSTHQLIETEIMKEEDYEYAYKNGYVQTLIKLLPKIRPNVPEVLKKFFDDMESASRMVTSNLERLKKLGIPCFAGGGMESPLGVLSLMRSYAKFCLDTYRHSDIVACTVEKFTEEIAQLAIASCKLSSIPRALIGLHRECSSFSTLRHFEQIGFPQIKRLVDLLSKEGIIAILHCDGDWTLNLPYLKELPKGRCVLELDASTDIFKAKELLGDSICIDGNLTEVMLTFGTPAKIEDHCKKLINIVGERGGFILKGTPPREAKPENIRAMINTVKTYGVYKA
ncbi:MAG: uroporphyrinogen decarboxylase family protein [Candidatus Jordarchaeum sp.]|uniref:uroporphyrinogen decarboxylase family protein n=1 Tax=Candidatus Jordarchaeum sp. TaxID=2823881 RepID=UPI00404A857E